jgi:hypothetical protein
MTVDQHAKQVQPSLFPAVPPQERRRRREKWLRIIGGIATAAAILFFAHQLFWTGISIRNALWSQRHMAEDIDDAMYYTDGVLRDAEAMAGQNASGETSPLSIANPGPGLLARPLTPKTFLRRWHQREPLYGQILRAWIAKYDRQDEVLQAFDRGIKPSEDRQLKFDYPPMRLLVLTLWTWHVQSQYPGLATFPEQPIPVFDPQTNKTVMATADIAKPMLTLNTIAEAIAAVSTFFLVWTWVRRKPAAGQGIEPPGGWRQRWGDPLLLAPVVLLGLFVLLRRWVHWTPLYGSGPLSGPLDNHLATVGFWIFLTLQFVSVVALARFLPHPFRGPVCGMVAATLVWLNPPMMVDGHVWPQWDVWLPAIFLAAAALASVDCWLTAGFVLGVGCMFKGQILFAAPVLVFSPLVAGYPERFMRIATGLMLGAALVVWPWIIGWGEEGRQTWQWIGWFMAAALLYGAATMLARLMWFRIKPWLVSVIFTGKAPHIPGHWTSVISLLAVLPTVAVGAAMTLFWAMRVPRHAIAAVAAAAILLAVPWVIDRRYIRHWLGTMFAACLWGAAWIFNGDFSWWNVGFAYGARKWQQMQLGYQSLSNLSSVLAVRFGWRLHDPVASWHTPRLGRLGAALHWSWLSDQVSLDLRQTVGLIFILSVAACTIGAGVHLRRRDPRFLIALTAPWVLMVALLTQMAARYTLLPAVMAASLVAVSMGMSLMQLLLTVLGCVMLGNQYLMFRGYLGPVTLSMTQPTYPDLGWATLLVAAIFLYCAVAPGRRRGAGDEVL